MTVIADRLNILDELTLDRGAHKSWQDGACVMEAVAFVAGEPFSDHPACASQVLGAYLRSWNDVLDVDTRNRLLKPLIPRLVGTAGTPAQEAERSWMAMDWLVRTYTPAWLRLAGLNDQAERLAGLPEFKAGMDVPSVKPVIEAVREDAQAAGDAARAAAWDAAGTAAWDAAGAAAWDAAGAAAGTAAGTAAWAAAWDAAGTAAGAAAGDAARAAAWDAAGAAAWDAAGDAAGARLQPVVDELQASSLELVERMLAVTY